MVKGWFRTLGKKGQAIQIDPFEWVRTASDAELVGGIRESLANGEFGGAKLAGPVTLTDDQAQLLARQVRVWGKKGIKAGVMDLTLAETGKMAEIFRLICPGADIPEVRL
jgi:hypothetical protein